MMYDYFSLVVVQLALEGALERKQQPVCSRHRRMVVPQAAQMLILPAVNSQLILSSM